MARDQSYEIRSILLYSRDVGAGYLLDGVRLRLLFASVEWSVRGVGVVRGGVFGLSGRRLGKVTRTFQRGIRRKLGGGGTRVRYVPAFVLPGTASIGNGTLILSLKNAGCEITVISFSARGPVVCPGGN